MLISTYTDTISCTLQRQVIPRPGDVAPWLTSILAFT